MTGRDRTLFESKGSSPSAIGERTWRVYQVEKGPHACAVTDRLRLQGQPMNPDTVADGAGGKVGSNERLRDLLGKGWLA